MLNLLPTHGRESGIVLNLLPSTPAGEPGTVLNLFPHPPFITFLTVLRETAPQGRVAGVTHFLKNCPPLHARCTPPWVPSMPARVCTTFNTFLQKVEKLHGRDGVDILHFAVTSGELFPFVSTSSARHFSEETGSR